MSDGSIGFSIAEERRAEHLGEARLGLVEGPAAVGREPVDRLRGEEHPDDVPCAPGPVVERVGNLAIVRLAPLLVAGLWFVVQFVPDVVLFVLPNGRPSFVLQVAGVAVALGVVAGTVRRRPIPVAATDPQPARRRQAGTDAGGVGIGSRAGSVHGGTR